jgi:hypothetical protein
MAQTNKSSNGHAKKDGKMQMHMPSLPKGKAAVTTMAGVAGAVVGAGVAVAATHILSDKQAREKVKETFNKVKTQVMDTIHEEQKRMNASSGNGQKKLGNGQNSKNLKGSSNQKNSPKQESKKQEPEMATGPQMTM